MNSKIINFSYKGNDYTLEFTRKSVEMMEKEGFVLSNIGDRPVSMYPDLFAGAFKAHHRFVKRKEIDEMLAVFKDKTDLFVKLIEMYTDTIESLIEEPKESEGNITWGASW